MDNRDADSHFDRLRKLPIQVGVRVCGRSLTLGEMLRWIPGTILSFDQPATSPLTLCVSGREVGEGQAVKVGSKIGIRLQRIGP